MDPKTTALLVKIVALFDSPHDGERGNAFTKAQELLERQGQSKADVLDVLTELGVTATAVADFVDWLRRGEAAAERTDRPSGIARPGDQAEFRADVIARYGSLQAALQPCEREAMLRSGVRQNATYHPPPNERWTSSLYGYRPEQPDGPARERALRALARACPLPGDLEDAQAEHAHWERRDRELRLLSGRGDGTPGLDLTAQLRRELVANLIRSELPVHGRADLQIRMQFWIDESQEQIDRAPLDEVVRLAEIAGRDLGGAIARNNGATTVLFAQWVCDVVVPGLQLPSRGRARSNRTFDATLRGAMRAALTEPEPPGKG